MDSILDSLTWDDNASAARRPRSLRAVWFKRALVLLAAVATLGVLLAG
ncbi:hypothetical protein [Polaromonas sp.]|nr:hypothetical protein [Polaromonas sp.]MDI1274701.1 hypothetical protein [Polaromonas sp.]